MTRRAAILLSLALCPALPAVAQDAPFSTEAVFGFGYLGGKVDEPVVAFDGTPSDRFAYREDSTGRSLALGATRTFGGVPDDGATPLDLLPFVARRSALGASVAIHSLGRDSSGVSRGVDLTITSRLTADASTWGGALDGTWFVHPAWAVHATASTSSARETQAVSTRQTPNGQQVDGSIVPRADRFSGSLGLVARPTADLSVELSGTGATAREKRTESGVVAVVQGRSYDEIRSDAATLGVALSVRALFFDRRLALLGDASYAATHGDAAVVDPYDQSLGTSRVLARTLSGAATWYPLRTLGLTLGLGYRSAGTTQGTSGERRVAARRDVSFRGGVRFFPRSRASVALEASRTVADTVTPPEGASFQRLRATDDRVSLAAALRF